MPYESYLLTMAQIAGVLVGFANLANALNRPGISANELQLNKLRIIVTTENGILIIIWCTLPVLLAGKMEEARLFQVLSGLGFVASATYMVSVSLRIKKTTGQYYPKFATIVIQVSSIGFTTLPLGLNAINAFGETNSAFVYCAVIYYVFAMVCVLFARLLYSVLPDVKFGA